MKRISFLLIAAALLIISGCADKKTVQSPVWEKHDLVQFKFIFSNFAKDYGITKSSIEMDTFHEITPENVFKETGCQIFKNGKTCESYLLYEGSLYTLGIGFGGLGIVDIATCDFDDNGKKELLYTYSWGSGLHRSNLGYFDLSKKSEEMLDISSDQQSGFIEDELALKKINDSYLELYIAAVKIDNMDFAKLSVEKGKLFGKVKLDKGKPVFFVK